MYGQVVFTKDEVEKIRKALLLAEKLDFQVYGGTEPYESAISILDSPRPRPKISMATLRAIGCGWDTPTPSPMDLIDIAIHFGFDVED